MYQARPLVEIMLVLRLLGMGVVEPGDFREKYLSVFQ